MNQSYFQWHQWLKKWYLPLLLVGIAVNATGLLVTILDSDGTLYATIAKTMVQSGDYLHLKVQGNDWLDKPHFPFWVIALSYKILGINTIGYKLPALLFWLMGTFYTYQLAAHLYERTIAQLAVMIYISATHLILSNNDVRAEPYLTGLLVASVYHFYKNASTNSWVDLLLGALFTAFAVMTKGPFIVFLTASGLLIHWLLKGEISKIFRWQWLIALLLIGIFILPELYSLYDQFDKHPEKLVFDRTNVSGIKFFFWDSQFGRFFNTGPIKGEGDKLFFLHTLLWAFLPWSVAMYAAYWWRLRYIRLSTHWQNKEYITVFTGLAGIALFSFSGFQLPHYTNILFPFFAILTGQYFVAVKLPSSIKFITGTQIALGVILCLVVPIILYFFWPAQWIYFLICWLILVAAGIFSFKKINLQKSFGASFLIIVLIFCFLNLYFYPQLLVYQSGSNAAKFANKQLAGKAVYQLNCNEYSFAFYTHSKVENINQEKVIALSKKDTVFVFSTVKELKKLDSLGLKTKQLQAFEHFHTSQLDAEFLNPTTRKNRLSYYYIASVYQ